MTLELQLAAIADRLASRALPTGDILRLVGKEPLAALERVVSQEMKSLRHGEGRLALLLAPKGQFRALVAVFRIGEEVVLLAPRGRGGELVPALSAYLKFSRVVIEPMVWSGGSTLLIGPAWQGVAAHLGIDAAAIPVGGCSVTGGAGERLLWLQQTFTGAPGAAVAAESWPARRRLDEALAAEAAAEIGEEAITLDRIRLGFPAWGAELTETVLPPEVGLETLAISYTKGCYVGQETIARLKTHGHPNRVLVGVRQTAGPDEAPDLPLALSTAGEEKVRGQLTSAGRHPALGWVGLALVRRELAATGTALSGAGRTFEVAALPFW